MIERSVGQNYSDIIRNGVRPHEATFLQIPKEVGERLVFDISETLQKVTNELELVLPEVGLISGWNEKLPDTKMGQVLRESLANATVNNEHPNGLIRLSPFYIKSELTSRMRIGPPSPFPLEFILAHEGFHLYQYKHNYEQVVRDIAIFDAEGLSGWEVTPTEILADEYAKTWLMKNFKQ